MKNWQEAIVVVPFSAIFFIVLLLLTRKISNLALQVMEKVLDVSQNSARRYFPNGLFLFVKQVL